MSNSNNAESVYCDNYALPTLIISKKSTKTDHHRFLERKFTHIGK